MSASTWLARLLAFLGVQQRRRGTPAERQVEDLLAEAATSSQHGREAEAEAHLRQAATLAATALGPDHPLTVAGVWNLVNWLLARNAFAEAEPVLQKLLACRERTAGPEHPDTALILANLAMVCARLERVDEQEQYCKRALTIFETALGEDHPVTAKCMSNLGTCYRNQGKSAEAESLHRRSLVTFERCVDGEGPDLAVCLESLGDSLLDQDKDAEAESVLTRAAAEWERIVGFQEPCEARCLWMAANANAKLGRLDTAEALSRRALEGFEQASGEHHPDTAICCDQLAGFLDRLGNPDGAEALLRRALAIFESACGESDEQTLSCLGRLAHLLARQGKRLEADAALRRYVSQASGVNGPYHADVCAARAAFAALNGEASAAATPLESPFATLWPAAVPPSAAWRPCTIRCGEDSRAGEFTALTDAEQTSGTRYVWIREAAPGRDADGKMLLGVWTGDNEPTTGKPFVDPAPWQPAMCAHEHDPTAELIEGWFTISADQLCSGAPASPAVLVSAPGHHNILAHWSGMRRDPTTGLPIVTMMSFPLASDSQG
jgi:tetratricopeptide (TPR) repeat protein